MEQARQDPVPLVVVGCDFRVASTMWREKMILNAGARLDLHKTLNRLDRQTGLVQLVTCNRSEWIVSAYEPAWIGNLMKTQMDFLWEDQAERRGYLPVPYLHVGREAARHVLGVVAGLESFVQGEQQIARQFHMAVKGAREQGTSTPILNGLEKIAGAMTKRLRDLGLARGQSVGIHSITAGYIRDHFVGSRKGGKGTVAVVGMGQIGRKMAGALEASGSWRILRVNRTLGSPGWAPLAALRDHVGSLDGIVFCTGSDRPLVSLSEICRHRRKGEPLWIIDIGVPAQCSLDAEPPPGVEVVTIDRLVEYPADRMDAAAAAQAAREVDAAVRSFEVFCRERTVVAFLDASQHLHTSYIRDVIPGFVQKNFAHLAPGERKRLIGQVRRLFIDFSSTLVGKFHASF